MKFCPCCKQEKTIESFCKDARSKDGRRCYCRSCANEKRRQIPRQTSQDYQNRYRAKNIEKVRAKGRERYATDPLKAKRSQQRYHLRHKEKIAVKRRSATLKQYGLTPAQYAERLKQQGNACAVCQSIDPIHWSGRFQVDHDHVTGAVRGLLCSRCNGGLGMFNDDMERLRKAILYIANAVCQDTAQIAAAGFFRAS